MSFFKTYDHHHAGVSFFPQHGGTSCLQFPTAGQGYGLQGLPKDGKYKHKHGCRLSLLCVLNWKDYRMGQEQEHLFQSG